MNLDDTLTELERFRDALQAFVDVVRTGSGRRDDIEQRLDGLFDDAFGREFTRRQQELDEPVRRFAEHGAETYLAFLDEKIHLLREYLAHA